ncbi:hypothetical protein MMAD_32240 [Mycolicibacterium madagascariense]|uniref:Uncharacterized protein n=1 Tax=Mycolicibacterium madagascariense TaxID=212765 RepID=A0A7I7XIA5_9MYCO|nr:hypothetical protein MMAD_32240 [Mycolicibacterium madagascariense]
MSEQSRCRGNLGPALPRYQFLILCTLSEEVMRHAAETAGLRMDEDAVASDSESLAKAVFLQPSERVLHQLGGALIDDE